MASNGFSSARKVSLSGLIPCAGGGGVAGGGGGAGGLIAGSLIALVWRSGLRRPGSPGEYGVNGLLEHVAVPLPPDGEYRHQRLRGVSGPARAELHGVLLGDYNIIACPRGPRESLHLRRAVSVMVLIRHELHVRARGGELCFEARRIGDPGHRNHRTTREDVEHLTFSGLHAFHVAELEGGDADRHTGVRGG